MTKLLSLIATLGLLTLAAQLVSEPDSFLVAGGVTLICFALGILYYGFILPLVWWVRDGYNED